MNKVEKVLRMLDIPESRKVLNETNVLWVFRNIGNKLSFEELSILKLWLHSQNMK